MTKRELLEQLRDFQSYSMSLALRDRLQALIRDVEGEGVLDVQMPPSVNQIGGAT